MRSLGPAQVVNKDIIITITLETAIGEWTLRESLAFSREGQKDFAVEIDELDRATVIFGDGEFGLIPPSGATIRATYRVGGGTLGNVLASMIKTFVDAPQLALLGAKVNNPAPATGGAERESIDHAVQHAPAIFRSLRRAVTAEDYQALALDFKGVGKMRAEAVRNWNTVSLYVAPAGGGYVSDVLRNNLLAYFEDKRPVSTLIEIENVDYVKVYVTAQVGIKPYYTRESVKEQVQTAAGGLLDFANVDFGRSLYLSKFYEAIEALDGIDYVTITKFNRVPSSPLSNEDPITKGKIELGVNEIARKPGWMPNDPASDQDYSSGIKIIFEEEA
ncbi:MAG: baseplate J/gp47 family protein [Methylococcales bacterium]|nr:baseplate J/gp47 family protein [Methylococcales bacterium]